MGKIRKPYDAKDRYVEFRPLISFRPFFERQEIAGLNNDQIAEKFKLSVETVKTMKSIVTADQVSLETVRLLCQRLVCAMDEVVELQEVWYYPANREGPDA